MPSDPEPASPMQAAQALLNEVRALRARQEGGAAPPAEPAATAPEDSSAPTTEDRLTAVEARLSALEAALTETPATEAAEAAPTARVHPLAHLARAFRIRQMEGEAPVAEGEASATAPTTEERLSAIESRLAACEEKLQAKREPAAPASSDPAAAMPDSTTLAQVIHTLVDERVAERDAAAVQDATQKGVTRALATAGVQPDALPGATGTPKPSSTDLAEKYAELQTPAERQDFRRQHKDELSTLFARN